MNRFPTMLAAMFLLLPALAPASVQAADRTCVPRVEGGWLRMAPAGMPMLAGFGRIANPCAEAATVASASSPAFAAVELHESRVVDGISRMRPVPALHIQAGGAAVLAPGGLHLMLMRPRVPLQAGETVEVDLTLSDGRRVAGRFEVRSATAR
jgi:periplasmic copper chaperone A